MVAWSRASARCSTNARFTMARADSCAPVRSWTIASLAPTTSQRSTSPPMRRYARTTRSAPSAAARRARSAPPPRS
jgi:hypothetical protein